MNSYDFGNINIGISSTAIEQGLVYNFLDGIGVTTQQLMRSLREDFGISVSPLAYPAISLKSFLLKSRNSSLPNGSFWPYPFSIATAISLLIGKYWEDAIPQLKDAIPKVKIDLYHALDYRIPKLKCPVIASLHDATLLKYPQWIRTQYRFLKAKILLRTIPWVSHVIALSHAMIPDLVEFFGIRPENITVVPLGVEENWFIRQTPDQISNILNRYQLKTNYVLFVGTLQPRKNIKRMLEAYTRLKPSLRKAHKLVIVGRLGWNTEEFMPLLKNLMSKGEVIWTQYVPLSDLRGLYQAASCLFFPSLYEGFGLPLLEAFASQVSVLTSNTSALPEISAGAAVEVDPHSVDEMAISLEQLIENEALRNNCIERGLKRAREFSWRASAQKTLEVYQRFL